jgi:hypothetical protein
MSLWSRALIPAVLALTCGAAAPAGWVTLTLDGFALDHPPGLDVTVLQRLEDGKPQWAMLRRRPLTTSPWTLVFGLEQSPLSEAAQFLQYNCHDEIAGGYRHCPEIRQRRPFQTDSGLAGEAVWLLEVREAYGRSRPLERGPIYVVDVSRPGRPPVLVVARMTEPQEMLSGPQLTGEPLRRVQTMLETISRTIRVVE